MNDFPRPFSYGPASPDTASGVPANAATVMPYRPAEVDDTDPTADDASTDDTAEPADSQADVDRAGVDPADVDGADVDDELEPRDDADVDDATEALDPADAEAPAEDTVEPPDAEAADDRTGDVAPDPVDVAPRPVRSGATTVADEVVEKVAGIAARKVAGVHALGTGAVRLLDDGAGDADKGLAVRIDGQTVTIAVTVVVEYGNRVYDVANRLREEVADAVESMIGVDVVAVDIVVEDVHIPE